jgi:orotidine-5'-phosphate decarboxylase
MALQRDVIIALDCATRAEADAIVAGVGDQARWFKVGIETLVGVGNGFVHELVADQRQVFLDLKLLEVPNSVRKAVVAAGELGASMVTVHASGGARVLEAAVAGASGFPGLAVLALTVITSLDDADLPSIGVAGPVHDQVHRLASLAQSAGCDGVVCSVQEAADMRALWRERALVVTPGIGLGRGNALATGTDQVRIGTPESAAAAGASHIVLGRSLTDAPEIPAAFRDAVTRFGA